MSDHPSIDLILLEKFFSHLNHCIVGFEINELNNIAVFAKAEYMDVSDKIFYKRIEQFLDSLEVNKNQM